MSPYLALSSSITTFNSQFVWSRIQLWPWNRWFACCLPPHWLSAPANQRPSRRQTLARCLRDFILVLIACVRVASAPLFYPLRLSSWWRTSLLPSSLRFLQATLRPRRTTFARTYGECARFSARARRGRSVRTSRWSQRGRTTSTSRSPRDAWWVFRRIRHLGPENNDFFLWFVFVRIWNSKYEVEPKEKVYTLTGWVQC